MSTNLVTDEGMDIDTLGAMEGNELPPGDEPYEGED
jgi:hypothetical protein